VLAVLLTFCIGMLLVPSLTASIFTGQGGQAAIPGAVAKIVRTRI
jgi:hypothetical protein